MQINSERPLIFDLIESKSKSSAPQLSNVLVCTEDRLNARCHSNIKHDSSYSSLSQPKSVTNLNRGKIIKVGLKLERFES